MQTLFDPANDEITRPTIYLPGLESSKVYTGDILIEGLKRYAILYRSLKLNLDNIIINAVEDFTIHDAKVISRQYAIRK